MEVVESIEIGTMEAIEGHGGIDQKRPWNFVETSRKTSRRKKIAKAAKMARRLQSCGAMTQVQRHPVVDEVLGAAIDVHRFLGPGLLESSYKGALAYEFVKRGIPFLAELEVPLNYKG